MGIDWEMVALGATGSGKGAGALELSLDEWRVDMSAGGLVVDFRLAVDSSLRLHLHESTRGTLSDFITITPDSWESLRANRIGTK